MKHEIRKARLKKLFDIQNREATKIENHFGKNSSEYRKALKSLDRIAGMIRKEILESRTPGTKKYLKRWKKNPAPGMAERSERIHKIRKTLVTALKKAIRDGNVKKEWEVRQKIRKLDYFMYAPRKINRRK